VKRLETYCKMRKGILKITKEDIFRGAIKSLSDGNYKIIIEKIYNKRSNPQNAYLWGVVYPIVKEGLIDVGFDEFKQDYELEMTHELCKFRFLQRVIDSSKQKENGAYPYLNTIGSTRKLKTIEFMEYLGNIQKWSSEYLGVYIPEPDPNYAETYQEL